MTDTRYDSPARLAAMIWAGVVSVYTTVVLPLIVSASAVSFGIAPARAGLVASAEMAGIAAGTFAVSFVIGRADRRKLVIVSALVAAVANAASIEASSIGMLLPLRLISGLGSGGLLGTMAAAVGGTRSPDRNFGIFIASAFLLAAISFGILSGFVNRAGAAPLFIVLTALNLSTLLVAPLFPRAGPDTAAGSARLVTETRVSVPVVAALAGILGFYLGVGSVWPMMGSIGTAFGLAPATVGRILAGTSVAALIGAIGAALLTIRIGRAKPLIAGLAIVVLSLLWLVLAGAPAFSLAPLVFLLSWNFSVPYMMGMLAVLDRSGRAVAFNMTLQYIGFACGPLVAALVAGVAGLPAVIWVGIVGCLACLACFVVATRDTSSRPAVA